MKIVFVSYNNQPGYNSPQLWLERIKTFEALMEAAGSHCKVIYVKQINYEARFLQNGVEYIFLRSNKKKSWFPGRINNIVKQLDPDIVIVSGILYTLQIIQLKWKLGRKVRIIGRQHADRPPRGVRRVLQRFADKCFNYYFFTSVGNATEWIDSGIIKNKEKICELLEASTDFLRQDKERSKQITGMTLGNNFIWVGRLNENKDPLTVLKGFEKYLLVEPNASLYMIYDVEDLLPLIKNFIGQNADLERAVFLKGYVPNNELPAWFSAADFYISGSHSEGGSYALLEAMACGCIPIVTAIPAAIKMTGDGKYGIIFNPGDATDLANKLLGLSSIDQTATSVSIENYFRTELSSVAIADKLYDYCKKLLAE